MKTEFIMFPRGRHAAQLPAFQASRQLVGEFCRISNDCDELSLFNRQSHTTRWYSYVHNAFNAVVFTNMSTPLTVHPNLEHP